MGNLPSYLRRPQIFIFILHLMRLYKKKSPKETEKQSKLFHNICTAVMSIFFVGIGHSNKLQYWKSITFKRPVGIINVFFMILKKFILIVDQLHARKCIKLSKWHVFATWKQVLSLYNADIGCDSVNTQYIDIQEIYWNKTLKKSRNNQISERYATRNKKK